MWQVNLETRAMTHFAVRPNIAARLLDDSINGGESKAGPFARRLGGEEGFEDPSFGFVVESDSAVANSYDNIVTRNDRLRLVQRCVVETRIVSLNGQLA